MTIRLTDVDLRLLQNELETNQYGADAHYHLARARYLLSVDTGLAMPSADFYAALEYRFCIERLFFTLLLLVRGEDSITRNQEKLYTGKSLRSAVIEAEPHILKKLHFLDLILVASNAPLRTAKPDLDRLSGMHGRLGDYLHSQKRPPETTWSASWRKELRSFLQDCDGYLGELLALDKAFGHSKQVDTDEIFTDWLNGKLSDQEAIDELERNQCDRS